MQIEAFPYAQKLFNKGEYGACEILLYEYLRKTPLDIEAMYLQGSCYNFLNRPDLAKQSYQNGIQIADASQQDPKRFHDALEKIAEAEAFAEEAKRLEEEVKTSLEEIREMASEKQENKQSDLGVRFKLTPYFGFVETPNQDGRNNFGLPFLPDSKGEHLPYIPDPSDNEFIVAIFGASVAFQFYETAAELLERELANHPDIAGRKVRVLCFASGASKQPQGLFYLCYFAGIGQPFDLIINIDGVNEISQGTSNILSGIELTMPSCGFIEAFSTLENLPGLDSRQLKKLLKLNRMDRWAKRLEPFGLAAGLRARRTLESARMAKEDKKTNLVHFHRQEPLKLNSAGPDGGINRISDKIIRVWRGYTNLMVGLAEDIGAHYYHVIHPTPFIKNREYIGRDAKIIGQNVSQNDRYLYAFERMDAEADKICQNRTNSHYCNMLDVPKFVEGEILHDIYHFLPPVYEAMGHRLIDSLADKQLSIQSKY